MFRLPGKPGKPGWLARPGVSRRAALSSLAGAGVLGGCASGSAREASGLAPVRFTHGVASGDPTISSLVIWTRAEPLDGGPVATVRFELALDEAFSRVVREGVLHSQAGRDFTFKADVTGLEAGRTYHYRFRAGEAVSPTGRGRTLPDAGAGRARLAVVSCSNYPFGYFNVYREIARRDDIDAVVHLGDYIYEYGTDGYGGEVGREIGRDHHPAHEIVTLADYRARFAQYRSDPDLQAVHAGAAFITVWDDHETANNSWVGGAGGHDDQTEGRWDQRRDAAIQAYFEWLPMRDPEPGQAAHRLNRVYDFGEVASLIVIETRLTGRHRQISQSRDMVWRESVFDVSGEPRLLGPDEPPGEQIERLRTPFDLTGASPVAVTDHAEVRRQNLEGPDAGFGFLPDPERFEREKLDDPARSLMGPSQEAWLAGALKASRGRGVAWQMLANQTIVARMRAPDFLGVLPPEMIAQAMASNPWARAWLEGTRLGLPINLDAWDGYAAARLRLYDAVRAADARLAVLTGDTHMFWGNQLHDPRDGERVGVEFGVSSVTSPGGYEMISPDPRIFALAAEALVARNPDVRFANVRDRGFLIVTATREGVEADYVRVDDILGRDYRAEVFARMRCAPGGPLTVETPADLGVAA